MENKNQQLFNSIFQNVSTAIQSINDISKKTKSTELLSTLNQQLLGYTNMKKELVDYCVKKKLKLKDNNCFEKLRLWASINMSTLMNNSPRKIAELMLLGTVMGTLTCYKDQVDYQDCNEELLAFSEKLQTMEEGFFDNLKKHLKQIGKKTI